MSQIRKILSTQNVVKAQSGASSVTSTPAASRYKYNLDGQDVYFTDEDLQEINNQIYNLPLEQRRFLGNAVSAIKRGNSRGNRNSNTVSSEQIDSTNLTSRDNARLREQKPSYSEAIFHTNSYDAKEAIGAYLQILHNQAYKTKTPTTKTKFDKSNISLDFNKDDAGNLSLSGTAGENFAARKRITDILDYLKNGKTSDYDMSDWDLGWMESWMAGLDGENKDEAARTYVNDLWNRMGTPGYTWGGNDEDFLRNFGITYGTSSGSGSADDSADDSSDDSDSVSSHYNEDGSIRTGTSNSNGTWETWVGDGTHGEKGALYTSFNPGDDRPYLINRERLPLFGLDDSYLDSIIYKNRIYKPSEIGNNAVLSQIMNEVAAINNSATSSAEAYSGLGSVINFTDYPDSNYLDYNSTNHFVRNKSLRDYLESNNITNAAIFNATNAYNTNGATVYGIYNYSQNGTGNYGFRTPRYIIIDNGQLRLTQDGQNNWSEVPFEFLNRRMGTVDDIYNRYQYNGKSYGRFNIKDAVTGEEFSIAEDADGNLYHINIKGEPLLLDNILRDKILRGDSIVANDIDESKKRVKKQKKKPASATVTSRKIGGVILKPLPVKLQTGSRLLTQKSEAKDPGPINDPMSRAHSVFGYGNSAWGSIKNMSDADRMDISAALLDLVGAVASFSPDLYTAIGGAGAGLISTGLMARADWKRRGEFSVGRTALNAGLDVLGALPVAGAAFKLSKIAKLFEKSPKLLTGLSNLFTAAGVGYAVPVLHKLVTQGYKSLTTDDLYALSSGLQASMGMGIRARRKAGDARLANAFANTDALTRGDNAANALTKHRGNVSYLQEQNIKLSKAEVDEIKGSENAAEALKERLKKNHNVDAERFGATDDADLLKKFGFKVENGTISVEQNATHTAVAKFDKTKGEFTLKKGQTEEVLAGGEDAGKRLRTILEWEHVDPAKINKNDKQLLEQFGFSVKMSKGETPKIISVKSALNKKAEAAVSDAFSKLKPEDNKFTKRGYLTDVWRGAWKRRDFIDAGMKNAAAREEVSDFIAGLGENEGKLIKRAYGRAQYRIGENPESIGKVGKGEWYSWTKDEDARLRRSAAEEAPSTQQQSTPQTNTPSTTTTATTATGTPQTNTPPAVPQVSTPEGVTTTTASASTPASVSRYKKATMTERANNLMMLQRSKDPLKKLARLEGSNYDKLFPSREKFDQVFNKMFAKNGSLAGKSKQYGDKLISLLSELEKAGRLYKRGGVLKALDGIKNPENIINGTVSTISTPSPGVQHGAAYNTLKQRPVIGDDFGGYTKNLPSHLNKILPFLSASRLAMNIGFARKQRDIEKEAAEAARYHTQAVYNSGVREDSPTGERMLSTLQNELTHRSRPSTNDVIQNTALEQERHAGIRNNIASTLTQIGQEIGQKALMNVQNQNQNNSFAVQNANANLGRDKAVDSAKLQSDAAYNQRVAQSFDNYMLELQSNVKQDISKYNVANEQIFKQAQQKQLDEKLDSMFPGARDVYERLPYNDRIKYRDFEDYLEKTQSTWSAEKANLDAFKQQQNNNYLQWILSNTLNYGFYGGLNGKTSPVGVNKKGGRITGKTRYTLEPDERIWIENNKAAHKAIAKLNDNAIKLILRALK